MIGGLRVWWWTGAVVVGVGAALLAGTGEAAADGGIGSDAGRSGSSQESKPSPAAKAVKTLKTAKSTTLSTKTAAAKRRSALGAAAASARTEQLNSTSAAADDTVAPTAAQPKAAKELRSRLTAAVTRFAATIDADNRAAANPFHLPHSGSTNTPAIPASATIAVTPASATSEPAEPAQEASAPVTAIGSVTTPIPPAQVSPTVRVSQLITAIRSLAAPAANAPPAPRPLATLVLNLLSSAGWTPRPAAVAAFPALAAGAEPTVAVGPALPTASAVAANGVTGVKVGHSDLTIPYSANGYTTAADWYFPTQSDGSVQATGVIWLQHGFIGKKSWYSALATQLARQTNSIVVAPNIASFPPLFGGCSDCTLNSVPLQAAAATMFLGDRAALNISANAAGFSGTLPEKFILTGHSAGGGFATAVGGFYVDNPAAAAGNLLGVVMFDGVSSNGTFAPSVQSLHNLGIPVYQIAAPPQSWNANGQTTNDLVALLPNEFTGVVLNDGSHVDSLIGGVPIIDFIAQLFIRRSPPGNTDAVYTLATGWINDMYAGLGPDTLGPTNGVYGEPDQFIVLGPTAAVVLGPPPVVDVIEYSDGPWYEVGSVKQFFSIGLVNTKAVYTPLPDGSIRVENSGNYFFNNGPVSSIVGNAVSLNSDNNKLNVSFLGPASATPPGNYWIVDLAPDYSWAIVTDSTGRSGFLLSRTPTVSDELYQELLVRASVKGANGWITRTRQPAAGPVTVDA